jgi:hypothetical protein
MSLHISKFFKKEHAPYLENRSSSRAPTPGAKRCPMKVRNQSRRRIFPAHSFAGASNYLGGVYTKWSI